MRVRKIAVEIEIVGVFYRMLANMMLYISIKSSKAMSTFQGLETLSDACEKKVVLWEIEVKCSIKSFYLFTVSQNVKPVEPRSLTVNSISNFQLPTSAHNIMKCKCFSVAAVFRSFEDYRLCLYL